MDTLVGSSLWVVDGEDDDNDDVDDGFDESDGRDDATDDIDDNFVPSAGDGDGGMEMIVGAGGGARLEMTD